MINEYKCGVCFEPSDLNGLKQFIETLSLDRLEELKIMGKKARMLSETKYSEKNILDKYIKIFE
jgi:glycosyltransferase involved in cell wall biosynthesis